MIKSNSKIPGNSIRSEVAELVVPHLDDVVDVGGLGHQLRQPDEILQEGRLVAGAREKFEFPATLAPEGLDDLLGARGIVGEERGRGEHLGEGVERAPDGVRDEPEGRLQGRGRGGVGRGLLGGEVLGVDRGWRVASLGVLQSRNLKRSQARLTAP